MKITVTNEKEASRRTIETYATTVKDLLQELKVNSETVLIARNSEILLPTETLKDGDEILLLSVISGG
ncbi:thiamine biosynthesis protein ThiS [archaeon]|nr:thiamine biosynthesis protein ThiS [archaeon]|tara:strand:- start:7461 stop:7664 length:204 start_codon:yes stop_codon:yes gene_type:complete